MSSTVTRAVSPAEEIGRLETRLQVELGGRVLALQVRPCAGGLLLQGQARTYHARQLAQQAFLAATDIPLVANDIEIHATPVPAARPRPPRSPGGGGAGARGAG